MVKKSYSIYKYIIYKWLLAFAALMAMQVLFLVANRHIFRPESAAEWLNILWGNVVFGAATVSTFLLPYLILMLIPGDFRWKKGFRIAAETLYLVPMLFVLITRGADSAYF